MGIKQLSKVIADNAAGAVKEYEMKNFLGRKVAVDASMWLKQFLIPVRQDGTQLQTETGDTTSHLSGMFYRTIRMIDNGIKPCYVFDGKPPDMKGGELEKRAERRAEAEKALTEAKEKGDAETIDKFERRLVKVTKEQNDDVKRLLQLMGVPVVEAPCEAEAQCAALVKAGKATATEDMDALTFGSNVLLLQLTAPESKKLAVKEINLQRVLSEMELSMEEFVDLCILLGCDYCGTISGIGPKKAVELIQQHKNIETVLENLDKKYVPPEDWPYKRARALFTAPEVLVDENVNLVWKEPDVEGLVAFMCGEKNFGEDRIRSAVAKMQKGRSAGEQSLVDSLCEQLRKKKDQPCTNNDLEAVKIALIARYKIKQPAVPNTVVAKCGLCTNFRKTISCLTKNGRYLCGPCIVIVESEEVRDDVPPCAHQSLRVKKCYYCCVRWIRYHGF